MNLIYIKGEKKEELLAYYRDGEKDLKYYESFSYASYDDFYQYIIHIINKKNTIASMRLEGGSLVTDKFSFNDESLSYSMIKSTITFSADLLCDEVFKKMLDELLEEYEKVSEETRNNIESKKALIDEKKVLLQRTKKAIVGYFKTGKVDFEYDKRFMNFMVDYISSNKDEIIKFLDKNGTVALGMKSILDLRKPHIKRISDLIGYARTALLGVVVIASVAVVFFGLGALCDISILGPLKFSLLVFDISGLARVVLPLPEKIRTTSLKGLYAELVESVEKASKEMVKSESIEMILGDSDIQQDIYLEYLKKAALYIKDHPTYDFSNESRTIYRLVQDYVTAIKAEQSIGQKMDRLDFLKRLTKLELSIYSKSTSNSNNKNYIIEAMMMGLEDRLKFLGIPCNVNVDDAVLLDIFATMNRVLSFLYDGCEQDIAELFEIAQTYVENANKEKSPKGYGVSDSGRQALQQLANIESRIKVKISAYIDSTDLSEDLSSIQGYLNSVGFDPRSKGTETAKAEETGTAVHM